MTDETKYYAIVARDHASSKPTGLARRTTLNDGIIDESLRRDLTWGHTSAIVEWNRGEELTRDLIEVSETEAMEIIERFRETWGREG